MRVVKHLAPALLLVLVLAAPVYALADEVAEATIEGWVESWEENEAGDVTAVYIDDGENWYVVSAGGEGAALLELVGQQVRATGTVETDPDDPSIKRITVTRFTVVSDEEEPEDPYNEPEPAGDQH